METETMLSFEPPENVPDRGESGWLEFVDSVPDTDEQRAWSEELFETEEYSNE